MVPASRPRASLFAASGLLLLLLAAAPVQASACPPADCIPIVPFPKVPYLTGDVEFTSFAADVQVHDAVARTALALTVRNDGTAPAQAHISVPLPDGAAVLGFNLTVDGRLLVGRVQERAAAQAEYEAAVQNGSDAALLTQADKRLIALDVNVAPGAERVLRLAYAESVPLASGARVYRLPLEQLDPRPAAFHLAVDVASRFGAADLASIGVPLSFQSGHGQADALPATARDLVLTWTEEAADHSSLVAARPLADGPTEALGTFCLEGAALPRDVAFILDQSGSMAGIKMTEAREALVAALGTVTPADRYTVVPFSSDAVPFDATLKAGSRSNVEAAQARAAQLDIEGGTNLDSALQEAFRQLALGAASDNLAMVVLLTDGLPTIGVTEHDEIIRRAEAANVRDAPIVVVPIGLDADYTFLADLALRSGGAYVDPGAPDEDLSDRLARLAAVLAEPVARDLRLTLSGADEDSVFPRVLPPVYADDCLEVRFRTLGDGPVTVVLAGEGATGPVRFEATFEPGDEGVEPAVRNLWGQAYVAELLSQERGAGGEDAALRQAVILNATTYGILTPYTAWVLADDQPAPEPVQEASSSAPNVGGTAGYGYGSSTATGTNTGSVVRSVAHDSAADTDYSLGTGAQASKDNKTPGVGPALLAVALLALAVALRRRP